MTQRTYEWNRLGHRCREEISSQNPGEEEDQRTLEFWEIWID